MDQSSTSIKQAYMKWLRLNVARFLKRHNDGKGEGIGWYMGFISDTWDRN